MNNAERTAKKRSTFRRRLANCLVVLALLASSVTLVAPQPATAQSTNNIDSILGSAGDTIWRNAVQSAIDPGDYVCGPTALGAFVQAQFESPELTNLFALFDAAALDWPIVYKLFFDNDDSDEYIGVNGEYTREHLKRQRDLLNFWDVPLDDVGLYGMHGSVMQDDAKMVQVVQYIFGFGEAEALAMVDDVQAIIETDPGLGYEWPMFSFNAVAFGPDPLKILMGDGLIELFEEIGLATNGVDLVYAHEMAHQVQGVLGVFGPPEPEETRRVELMADAFATYYLVHARGASFNARRTLDAFELSFIAGDCNFDSPGHHGTPNQRLAAAEWGAELAQERPRGKIRSAVGMVALFHEQLPIIVAPDAP